MSMGYLGGFGWVCLSAYICSSLRKEQWKKGEGAVESLLHEFFTTFAEWDWTKRKIVLTKDSNKAYQRKRRDVMPIVAPTYPFLNSTRNTTRSTLSAMTREFRIGSEHVKALMESKEPLTKKDWQLGLFAKSDFFVRFERYLALTICCMVRKDAETVVGWMDGRLIGLVFGLERTYANTEGKDEDEDAEISIPVVAVPLSAHLMNIVKKEGFPVTVTYFVGLWKTSEEKKIENLFGEGDMNLTTALRRFEVDYESWKGKPPGSVVAVKSVSKKEVAEIVPKKCLP